MTTMTVMTPEGHPMTPESIQAHAVIMAEVARLNLPEYDANRAGHNPTKLTAHNSREFLWIVRADAEATLSPFSLVLYLDSKDTIRVKPTQVNPIIRRLHNLQRRAGLHIYHFVNGQLIEIDHDQAVTVADTTYRQYRIVDAVKRRLGVIQ